MLRVCQWNWVRGRGGKCRHTSSQAVYLAGNNREPFRAHHAAGDDKVFMRALWILLSFIVWHPAGVQKIYHWPRDVSYDSRSVAARQKVWPFSISPSGITQSIPTLGSQPQRFIPFLCEQMRRLVSPKLKYIQVRQQEAVLCKQIKAESEGLQVRAAAYKN